MKRFFSYMLFLLACSVLYAQKWTVSGYVKDMEVLYLMENPLHSPDGGSFKSTTYNQIHNRLNIDYQPVDNLRFELGVRNRLISGQLLSDFPWYSFFFETDKGVVDLSWNLVEKQHWFLNTSIDRCYMDYTFKKFQLRIGRQRINWGIDLVWNPNDLFNAYSYLDFDYEERPGSDAVLFTWYTSGSSSLDVAFKTDGYHRSTAAARYLFNVLDYDIQFIAGKNENDWVLGGGWSGNIGKMSFRGEGSFFKPLAGEEEGSVTSVSATVSADYTFENSLYLHSAFLFNSAGTTEKTGGISLLDPNASLSAKKLSIGKYEIFGQISYPFSPIVNASVAGMFNPSDRSCYLGPTATISLQNNLELMLAAQLLMGETGTEYGELGNTYACFGRLRWSF